MTMTVTTQILLSIGYVAVAVLLLSLNLASSWRWQVKIGAIVLVSALYVGTYMGAKELPGWASRTKLPDYFRLHWGVITEPDKFSGEDGRILVWVEALDDKDQSLTPPRAHELAYDDELAQRIEAALGLVAEGESVTGSLNQDEGGEETPEGELSAESSDPDGEGGDAVFPTAGAPPDVHFEQMKPPEQPAKSVL
jgi:hypothetical protein